MDIYLPRRCVAARSYDLIFTHRVIGGDVQGDCLLFMTDHMIVKEYFLYLFLITNRSHSLIYCQSMRLHSLVLSEDVFFSYVQHHSRGFCFFRVRIARLYVSMMPFYSHVHIVFVETESQSQNK